MTKRIIDVALAGGALLMSLPVQAIAIVAILVEDGRPVLYRQIRAGRHGCDFEALKFRTMRVNTVPPDNMGRVGLDHELVTKVGRALRRLKVDELPQLLNVLRGEMSLVGPRPTLPSQVAAYDAEQSRRMTMRPGLTGWAQVNGNIAWEWPERILLDVWYVDHWSLGLDLKILARTIDVIVRGERRNELALKEAWSHAEHSRRRG